MPLQDAIPDTSAYLVAGYVAFALIFAIYLASFVIRRRNLEQDLKTLQALRSERSAAAVQPPRAAQGGSKTKASPPAGGPSRTPRKRATPKK